MKYLFLALYLVFFGVICLDRCEAETEAADNAVEKAWAAFIENKDLNDEVDYCDLSTMEGFGVYSVCRDPRHLALTYDDGIHHKYTPELLETLRELGVKGNFFVLGNSISKYLDLAKSIPNPHYKRNREIMQQMVSEGHILGSHTFDHTRLPKLSTEEVQRQMGITSSLIKRTVGLDVSLMRAPEGALSLQNIKDLREWGYTIVHWNVDTKDYEKKKPKQVVSSFRHALSKAAKSSKGHIILQHDIFKHTVRSQRKIIQRLLGKGYSFVDLYTCFGMSV